LSGAACTAAFLFTLAPGAPAQAQPLFHGSSVSPPLYVDPSTLAIGSQSGWVVITEFMKDPSSVGDTAGEWIEVYNALPWRVNLEGWTLSDSGGAQHVLSNGGAGLRYPPGAYIVLGNNADPATNGGVQVDYEYAGFVLGNGADQIILTRPNGAIADRVDYDDGVLWPDTSGRSISLDLAARDVLMNDDGANWCHSSLPISGSNPDTGTPGLDNDACP
jgi:hypothetical protein